MQNGRLSYGVGKGGGKLSGGGGWTSSKKAENIFEKLQYPPIFELLFYLKGENHLGGRKSFGPKLKVRTDYKLTAQRNKKNRQRRVSENYLLFP